MRHHLFVPCLLLGALFEVSLAAAAGPLANTQWRLVEFQSMDDSQGAQRPSAPSRYVLRLDTDGTATIWLNCNRVTGTWLIQPAGKGSATAANGVFRFDHFPERMLPCAKPGLEEKMLRQISQVRSFTLKQGRLHLGLMADSGTQVWARDASVPATAPAAKASPAQPAAASASPPSSTVSATSAMWQVTRRVNLREQPSTQSRVLALLPAGSRVQRGECQSAEGREWCRVTVQAGGEGFVAAEYLQPAS